MENGTCWSKGSKRDRFLLVSTFCVRIFLKDFVNLETRGSVPTGSGEEVGVQKIKEIGH